MNIAKGAWLAALGPLFWLAGCASVGPPLPPSLELPKAPSDLRASRKGDVVTLTWTVPSRTTDRKNVRYLGKTRICRSTSTLKQCGTPVGEAPAPDSLPQQAKGSTGKKAAATFTDTLPSSLEEANPRGFATYAVEVLNRSGRSAGISNQVHVSLVPVPPPFADFSAQATAQGVLIRWRCPATSHQVDDVRYLFRIYRKEEADTKETRIAEVDVNQCVAAQSNGSQSGESDAQTSFLDQSFIWEKTYAYRGAVVSVTSSAGKSLTEVEGDDTASIKLFAHDVFPPVVPASLQAVSSGPGQPPFIDLIWAPVMDADLDGYNVYRREEGAAMLKLNSDPLKTPAYRDTHVSSGKTYFYAVSAIDERGNESSRSAETSETYQSSDQPAPPR